ncbi:MAG: MFS transporter [Planctomycetes bacterium]|nr:MFS transporter [Planctomycetota bacterium]
MAEDFSPQQRRSSLNLSIWDGVFAQFHAVLAGGNFLTYYLLAYDTSYFQFSLVSAIPNFALLIQPISAHWLQSHMHLRKPLTIITANISRFAWLLIAIIPFLFPKTKVLSLFFIVYAIINLSMAIAGNSWISWMADAIPSALRGRYFSRRNLLCTIVNPTGVLAGWLYTFVKNNYSIPLIGAFSFVTPAFMAPDQTFLFIMIGLIFILAVFAGALPSMIFLIKQPEPPYVKPVPKDDKDISGDKVTIVAAIKYILKNKDLKVLFLVMTIWHIVNGFSAPFWGLFRLKHLQMSLTAVNTCDLFLAPLFTILSLMVWGKIIDRFGNKTVILFTLYVTAFHPLFYVVSSPNFTALIYLDAISSGLMWSGFTIAILNLQLAFIPKHGREIYLGIYSALVGLTFTIPMLISGWVVDLVANRTFLSLHAIPIVLWLVSVGRFGCLIWFAKINDPKEKPMVQLVMHLITEAKEGFIGLPKFFMPKADYNALADKNDEPPSNPGQSENIKNN